MKKLLITTFFGPLPDWMDKYEPPKGYDFLLITDLEDFNRRVKEVLGFDSAVTAGTGKPWDFRPALGLLYADKLVGYDWWGITDLDCVYGEVDKWGTDEFLDRLDVWSNHNNYVCGCWTLFRNTGRVNNFFKEIPDWEKFMFDPTPNGWVEKEFSRALEQSGLRFAYTFYQGNPWAKVINLKKVDGKLYQDGQEIMMHHFRYAKKWPL